MILNSDFKFINLSNGNLNFKFLETGDLFEIISGRIMINMFNGNVLDGSLNNIYLRLYKNGEIFVFTLLGINSSSRLSYNSRSILFQGNYEEFNYEVRFLLSDENIWFYEIDVYGNDLEFDVVYGQDVGISNKKSCVTNELYVSQYIDHKILENENGYVVCSKQNQEQDGKFPYVEHGSLNSKIISYSTDQMQFFSKEYKLKNFPKSLGENLPGENYQFELSYVGIQTEKFKLKGHKNIIFYGLFEENYVGEIKNLIYSNKIRECFENLNRNFENLNSLNQIKIREEFGEVLVSEKFSEIEINAIYNGRKFEEKNQDGILSFFTEVHSHVVLREKEILCERPHGNILLGGICDFENLNSSIMASTNYMFGVFNSHVVVGNAVLNKMISVNRGLLNIFKSSGQRIYVKIQNKFHLLTIPGIYEMGLNFSIWYYKFQNDILCVKVYTSFDSPKIFLEFKSENGIEYEFIITNQVVMGESEYENSFDLDFCENKIKISPLENSFLKNNCPNIFYEISLEDCKFSFCGDEIFFEDGVRRNKTLVNFKIFPTDKFKISIFGSLNGESPDSENFNFHRNKFENFYKDLINGFEIHGKNSKYDFEKLNEIIYFYVHNALIHFISPHGLEQSNGGAWGTRDVCQGPFEFFMSVGKYKIARKIILKIFSHQFFENGEFPQWFMFDNYNMQQDNSHGDIVFWPLKILSEYILKTGDDSLLYEKCVYRSFPNCEIKNPEIILKHVERAIKNIESRFLNGTNLIKYDGGDWNDTLQPVNSHLKNNLVSTWVMALAYETFSKLHEAINEKFLREKFKNIFQGIKNDFLKFGIKDNVIGGFIYFKNKFEISHFIHPSDEKTGISYRLLPMTRSIISEIVDLNQGIINEKLISEHLTFNDGVRLMDKVPKYKGGVCEIFKRAEQASNVGREISLQYVHAHIRFIEAMCKLGKNEKVWEGLYKINPINIKEFVKNSDYRQSNCYFSSSDGNFLTRYDFENRFEDLKNGSVKVKGGWRIYSSGPGIFIGNLISNVIGIREEKDRIIFDPILPEKSENFMVKYKILGRDVEIFYKMKNNFVEKILLNGKEIESKQEGNIYRNNFKSIEKQILLNEFGNEENIFEIF